MSEGIKESKEVLVAMNELALVLIKVFGNGIQASDAVQLVTAIAADESVKSALFAAYENYNKVPDEMKDLDASEVVELVSSQLQFVPKIVSALKA